jgi:hypothetical protein
MDAVNSEMHHASRQSASRADNLLRLFAQILYRVLATVQYFELNFI